MDSSDEGGGFEALPNDEYEVVVTDAKAKVASTGRNMIETKYRVENGPYKGRTIFNNFVIVTDNTTAKSIFFRNMAAMGLKTEFFRNNPSLEDVADALVERRCRVRVSTRTYGGQERNQVDAVFPPSSGAPPVSSVGSGQYSTPPPPAFAGEPPF